MDNFILELRTALADGQYETKQQLAVFALLNLGIVQSLAGGVMSSEDAIRLFYNADNCLYVRKHLKNKNADAIMGHGVQLPDLFNFLPVAEAHREFTHELEAMRSLCLRILESTRPAAGLNKRKIVKLQSIN
ncbi:MAG: hypothetical protein ACREOI_13920 [bacterium]